MHDPRPHFTARQLLKVIRERVGQRARRCARRRMDHEPGRFIYDDQRLIFVNDFERNIFRCKDVRGRRYQVNFNLVMFAEFVGGFCDLAVYQYVFVLDQPLQTRTTPAFKLRSEINVKTSAGVFWSNLCNLWITHCAVQNPS
jgi:hypothetical protein